MASPEELRAAPGVLRWALVALGLGAALVVYLMGRRPRPPEGPDLRERLAELAERGGLGRWRIVEVREPGRGAISLVMETADGTRFRLEVLRRDAAGPRGPAETESLAIHLADVAPGAPTPEEQGLGAMTLAAALAGVAPPRWLLTHRERKDRLPA